MQYYDTRGRTSPQVGVKSSTPDAARHADTPTPRCTSPLIAYLACPQCGARFYGEPRHVWPLCPDCRHGRLRPIGTWNLSTDPWFPFCAEEVIR